MDAAEARTVAREVYGLDVATARLDTEKDDTFRLCESDRARFIMKVSNPAEAAAELELQVAMLQHLSIRDPLLPIPAVIPSTDGRALTTITDAAGQQRRVRLLSFIDGLPMDRTPASAAQRRNVGTVLARLRLGLVDFEHPGADRLLAWDVRHLLHLADDLEAIPDARHRRQLERALERFTEIQPAVQLLRRQVLHNDFSKSNLITDRRDPERLLGVIDFGDAVNTAVAIDVSTALLNQLPRDLGEDLSGDVFVGGRDLLDGYLELAELTGEELALLPHLVMARVTARAIITHGRAALFPDNATYIMRNTEQGWAQLDWFLSRSPEQVSDTFCDAPRRRSPRMEGSSR
jgi:Ser/Thr protein kinase RdoA (MazF antagonist)